MCGVVGYWEINNISQSKNLKKIITSMKCGLENRGPDDSGIWIDKKNNLFLGHTRLSIIETSNLGKQPMISKNERFIIVYNGEIYNFHEIKEKLKKSINFKGNSDTEVLLEACSFWGIKKTLLMLSGMFAFAIWDKKKKKLVLARDRFGIKPLYYSLQNKLFLFGSQTKVFKKHPKWKKKINFDNVSKYFNYGYVPTSNSIYKNTYQVPPGYCLIVDKNGNVKKKCYWNLTNNINNKGSVSLNDIEKILESSVKQHMISDVPIGSFLSGGIDSSLITSLMQKNSIKPIKTFSIGFEESLLDESKYSKLVAKHLGTEHCEAIFKHKDMIDLISNINEIYDEPFADSSQLPTILLSKITSKKVKVALSGDGGDEFFGGYNRYNWSKKIKSFYRLPLSLRKNFCELLKFFPPNKWDKIFKYLPYLNQYSFPGDKIYKLSNILSLKSFSDVYPSLTSQWYNEELPILGKTPVKESFSNPSIYNLDVTEQMQIKDMATYLPGDILTKVDRASMQFGLEVRVPFINNDLIKKVWLIDDVEKRNKSLLRKLLYKFVPKKLVDRPKMGFSIPLGNWLRGPLRDWSENLLEEKKLKENNLNSNLIKNKWKEHLSGYRNWQYPLWTVLIYQSWRES